MAPHMRDTAQLSATASLSPTLSGSSARRLRDQTERTERQSGGLLRDAMIMAVIGSLLAAPVAAVEMTNGWTLETTLRHFAAAPGCKAAGAVGLAPARMGEPGYWSWLDRGHSGFSCTPP